MKRTFLCNILLTSALIAICMASFTGCFHENIRKDTSHISETELKQLEGNAEDVVKHILKRNMTYRLRLPIKLLPEAFF